MQLDCVAPESRNVSYLDLEGPGWAEVPVDYFYHLNPSSGAGPGLPSWNPYAGSRYPVVFDGHNGHASPTRWITRRWPGDTGRDIVIFLRVVFWTLGVFLCLVLLDVPLALIAVAATAATLAPHLSVRIDHVMLDVDLLAPWFPVIVLALVRGAIPLGAAAVASVALGALVGSLSLLQAQFVFLFACGVASIAAVGETRCRSLALASLVAVGLSGSISPGSHWSSTSAISSRVGPACIAGLDHTGIEGMGMEVLSGRYLQYSTGSSIGMMVILLAAGRLRVRFFVYALAMILVFVVVGFPSVIRGLLGISGVYFGRHLTSHLQFFYVIACGRGSYRKSEPGFLFNP